MDGVGDAEYEVLLYEFKTDLAVYLETSKAPYRSLAELIDYNDRNADSVMPIFGQDIFIAAEEKGGLDDEAYLAALELSKRKSQVGLDTAFEEHSLDALVAISNSPSWVTDHVNGDNFQISSSSYAAISGYPNVTVPAGFVFDLPVGVSFMGRPWTEAELLNIAYAFEQASNARRKPPLSTHITD